MAFIFMPLAPPEALISLIAINVASWSDFSMIERPPVSENNTPTFNVPAARTGLLMMYGDASAPVVASRLPFKNLRRSIDIVTLPLWPPPRQADPVRAEARCFQFEKFQILP